MKKTIADFLYWLFMKTTENYYGESIKKEEVPYTPYF